MKVVRLTNTDTALGKKLFVLMASVFEEDTQPLEDPYLEALLANPAFWVLGVWDGDTLVGGLTAHALPMTRSASKELFLYDLAVLPDHQRRGAGRALVQTLMQLAAAEGFDNVFVPADVEDTHAVEFYRALQGEEAPVAMFTWETTDGRGTP
jgi:aminoglycoside 3-N-acetyltransferase I